jgi:DNA polymerase (family 10)
MRNLELAQIFYQMADLLDMKEVSFKPRAYEKVARVLESLEKDVGEIYQEGGLEALEKIPGVGEGIAQRIEEFIKTGRIKDYEKLKKECPVDLESLTAIEGLGSKKIKVLYKKLKIKNLKDLEKAAKAGKIRKLAGFGEKSEKNILQGIAFVKAGKGRFLLGLILPVVRQIIDDLKQLPEVGKISVAGSVRRMKETIGDIDILITSAKPEKVMDFFVQMPEVVKVWAKGPTKSSVRLKGGFDCDLRVIRKESFGAALQYFTGSKDHNILTRRIARQKGLKLNEYGVYKGKKRIAGQTEKEVYQAIGLPYIEPELRTNTGEIETALTGKLPKIIGYDDIKGDLHCHTDWSDGMETIEQMARAAKKIGYQYLAITDHTGQLKIAGGLDERRLLAQMAEIDRINKKFKDFKILKGCEVNIKNDGSLDIKDEVLAKLDIVVASIHSSFKMDKATMTKRLVRAIENPHVDIIGHPTGRVIFQREGYQFDFDKVLQAAKKTKTALEINAYPDRLDLRDMDVRKAVETGVKLVISTDAHNISQFHFIELGIAQARRGWAEKKDIWNTRSLRDLLKKCVLGHG